MHQLKIFYYNNITWVYTLQYIFFSIILLLLVWLIDLRIIPAIEYLPEVIQLKVEFSQNLLITLSAAFLTITTFTFSTILNVLNTYASSFSPRVVENFIHMKITLKVIGIFIGGFFYCVSSLIFTRDFFNNEVIISGFVAIVYSIICIIYFVIFIQRVITKFQGVNVISDIANIAQEVIDGEVKLRQGSKSFDIQESFSRLEIQAINPGYFSSVDLKSVTSLVATQEGYLRIDKKLGEYVAENTTIATLCLNGAIDEGLAEKIRGYFVFQDKKIETIDYRYNLTKLLEIALRALSPGINDPNTAIHCIHKLGVLLSAFAKIDGHHIKKVEDRNLMVYYSSYSFAEDLAAFYLPIIHYGKDDLQVILALLGSLTFMYGISTPNNRKAIVRVVGHIQEKVEGSLKTELERSIFESQVRVFAHVA